MLTEEREIQEEEDDLGAFWQCEFHRPGAYRLRLSRAGSSILKNLIRKNNPELLRWCEVCVKRLPDMGDPQAVGSTGSRKGNRWKSVSLV